MYASACFGSQNAKEYSIIEIEQILYMFTSKKVATTARFPGASEAGAGWWPTFLVGGGGLNVFAPPHIF